MKFDGEICDKVVNEELRNKNLKSNFHNILVNSIIMKHFMPNPNSSKIADII